MSRKLISCIAVLLLLLSLAASLTFPKQVVHAKPQDVFATNKVEWGKGTNYGAQTYFGTSFPGLPANQCQYTLHRYIQVSDALSGENDNNSILITGIYDLPADCQILINTGQSGNCYQTFSSNTLVFFMASESIDGKVQTCNIMTVPSGLVNKDVQYNIWGAHSDGNGSEIKIYSCAVSPCFSWNMTFNCVYTSCYDPDYSEILLSQTINVPLCSGHCVWGINWYNNYWADGSHVLHPQSSPSPGSNPPFTCSGGSLNGCPSYVVPNGFVYYWTIGGYPSQSSSGGFANACFYESYPANYPYCIHNG